ncbi:dihydrofolate reductase [Ferrovum sp.]|uniref:dihydrofolate reductase n=1 Tax=Ferrovum sp. TaxID=2609467 RepID=UPI0026220612|nr:dihydrofolate reductase [Ferrovum sp.]
MHVPPESNLPRLSFVVAHTVPGRVIGNQGTMPWHLPADLAHFRAVTLGHPVLMGRRTQESIGRPLPGRLNLVISRNQDYRPEGCLVYPSLEDLWANLPAVPEVFVIGGGTLYESLLPRATRVYVTRIHADVPGDTFFPILDPAQWREIDSRPYPADAHNAYDLTFATLERINP